MPMRCCVSIALGALGCRCEHQSCRLELCDALRPQSTADGGGAHAYAAPMIQLQAAVQAAEINAGFVVMPDRWAVERTHAWSERSRRTVMQHARKLPVSAA